MVGDRRPASLPSIGEIEARFLADRAHAPRLLAWFDEAFVAAGGQVSADAALVKAGGAVAAALDDWAAAHGELPYHGRHHTGEVVRAMGWLCAEALRQGLVSPLQAKAGVVAMLGHDLEHDGTARHDGVLEARSAVAVVALARAAGVEAEALAILADVIGATDPALVADNVARAEGRLPPGPMGTRQDALRRLANEADVFASLLPVLGQALGEALAKEWVEEGAARIASARSTAGRLAFLRSFMRLSEPAMTLGLGAARDTSLRQAAAVGPET